jgi:hypothetical protein
MVRREISSRGARGLKKKGGKRKTTKEEDEG